MHGALCRIKHVQTGQIGMSDLAPAHHVKRNKTDAGLQAW